MKLITGETNNNIDIEPTTSGPDNNIGMKPTADEVNNDIKVEVDTIESDRVINNMDAKLNANELGETDKTAKKKQRYMNLICLDYC